MKSVRRTRGHRVVLPSTWFLWIVISCWRLRRRWWHPTPVLLPGKPHGRRSLVGWVHGVAKSQTRLSNFTFSFHFRALEKEMATHSSVLAWRIPGTGSLVGCRLWGRRVGHDWSDAAAAACYCQELKQTWFSSSTGSTWTFRWDSLLGIDWN